MTYLSVFDKIGIDWTASIAARPPLQVVHIRFVGLGRTKDDRCLWCGTIIAPISGLVDWVTQAIFLSQEMLKSLIALHGM